MAHLLLQPHRRLGHQPYVFPLALLFLLKQDYSLYGVKRLECTHLLPCALLLSFHALFLLALKLSLIQRISA
jgi:hypothetical protein